MRLGGIQAGSNDLEGTPRGATGTKVQAPWRRSEGRSETRENGHYPTVSAQRPWPVRYEVTLRLQGGGEVRRTVLTWLSREKAVALAVQALSEDRRVYEVDVAELGPAPRAEDGTVATGSDLHDRYEF